MSTDFSFNNTDVIENKVLENTNKNKGLEIFGFKNQTEFNEVLMKFQLKYYNLFAFLLLPFYTLISFLVFRKPYNFGEHLVINTYLQSITSFFSVLLFIFSLLIGINLFGTGITILPFLYYCFAFKKLYKLTFGQLLLKVLKFFGISCQPWTGIRA